MCRLLALTATDIDAPMRKLFFSQLMLISNADGQRDGAGVTDGHSLYKSHYPYLVIGSEWIDKLNAENTIWMGHVRSASGGTDITPYAAHPFRFVLNDNSAIYAAHNGFIRDMPKSEGTEPRSDSYQAFKYLSALLNEQQYALTWDNINAWLALFGTNSEWAHMLHYQNKLFVLRGNRTMFYMRFGNGFVFNTSNTVLLHFKEWIHTYWRKYYTVGRIEELSAFQGVVVAPGSHDMTLTPLTKTPVSESYTDMYYRCVDAVEQIIKA